MKFNTFDEVIAYMEGFTNLEKNVDHYTTRTYRLDRMQAILEHIGHPERSYKKLHIAGSKGKGSTASYLASGLVALGHKCGLYLSPHLLDYRERFTLGGKFIDDMTMVKVGNELKDQIDSFTFSDAWGESNPTTFELYTVFAFMLFKELECDWAVIETGLGGRLDATNTIIGEASILCPIELEHTRILGDTIGKIAIEKSKIIKPGVPVFVGFESEDAFSVFQKEAQLQHSKLYSLAEEMQQLSFVTTEEGEKVTLQWKNGIIDNLTLKMLGQVQAQNCALALLVLRTLGLYDEATTKKALEANTLPGRFEKICENPRLYVDGAHTVHSLLSLFQSYSTLYPQKEKTVIYGALEDKDHLHMSRLVLDNFDHIIISTPGTYKKSNIQAIYDMMKAMDNQKDIKLIPNNAEALLQARKQAGETGNILVCGSFYLAGNIAKLIKSPK
ncbi:MAG: cyanophycin synthetase [Sphaerochaetaceae bacterium]